MAGGKHRRRKGGTSPDPVAPKLQPWTLRFSSRILDEDLRDLGHAACETARKVIGKKLAVDLHQYGDGLRRPLGGIYKLKSSHVRIAYHIEESAHEVWILMIADRSVIWDRHENEIMGRRPIERGVDEVSRRLARLEASGILIAPDAPDAAFPGGARRRGALKRFLQERDE